jgi:hypothetical protein
VDFVWKSTSFDRYDKQVRIFNQFYFGFWCSDVFNVTWFPESTDW